MGSTQLRENNVQTFQTIDDEQPTRWSGTKTHPYDDTAAVAFVQYEFTAVWRSVLFAKAVTADTALKLLAAAMINRGRARECLEGIMIFEFVGCILVIIFLVFLWKDFFCEDTKVFQANEFDCFQFQKQILF